MLAPPLRNDARARGSARRRRALRRAEAMGYWLAERAGVSSDQSGGGGRTAASASKVLTECPTEYPSRQRVADGNSSERFPTASEARTKYSQSTP